MMKYIGNKENLKLIMNLLRIKSTAIQFEAFHVFKARVAGAAALTFPPLVPPNRRRPGEVRSEG